MVEEYTTFSTSTRGPSDLSPELLDAKFCRELLRSVPKMIERTRSLSNLSPEVIPNGACLVYLKEAVRCYILGLSQASIALARAAVETALLQRDPNIPGKNLYKRSIITLKNPTCLLSGVNEPTTCDVKQMMFYIVSAQKAYRTY